MGTIRKGRGSRPRDTKCLGMRRALAGALLLSAVLLSGFGASQVLAQQAEDMIAGVYNINELRRLLEIAEESGFTEEQMRNITVEDEKGTTINAWAFIRNYEKKKKEEEARLAAERAKKYLTPNDIMKELDGKQPKDIENMRDNLLWVE